MKRSNIKIIIRCILLCTVVLALLFVVINYYRVLDTQYTTNKKGGDLLPPVFSLSEGFYSSGKKLKISTSEDTDIYYTLDGSDPVKNGVLYTHPLELHDPSSNENRYANIADMCLIVSENLDNSKLPYTLPEEPVDKAYVIRAVCVSKDGSQSSQVITKTYFVDFDEKGYSDSDMDIISLVGDPEDLFGYEAGILVSGKIYDEYKKANPEQCADPDSWFDREANYTQHGIDWERCCNIEYFDSRGKLRMNQDVGARVKGASTRACLMKSMTIRPRKEYSNSGKLIYSPFGQYGRNGLTIYAGCDDDEKAQIRQPILFDMAQGFDFASNQTKLAYFFLNGEFWGVVHLAEIQNESYMQLHYGLPKDDVELIKDFTYYQQDEGLKALVENADFADDAEYEKIWEYIDKDSYFDYYSMMIYMSRCGDWPRGNMAVWRSISRDDGLHIGTNYQDHRFRFIMFDVSMEWGGIHPANIEFDSFAYLMEQDEIFSKLSSNARFREEFAKHFVDFVAVMNSRWEQIVDKHDYEMQEVVMQQFRRFYGDNWDYSVYEEDVEGIREFFDKRDEYILGVAKNWMVDTDYVQ